MNRTKRACAVQGSGGETAAVCRVPRLKKLPEFSKKELALCPLPSDPPAELRRAFAAAPQFRRLDADALIAQQANGLRVVLLGESDYYARQAAAYLTAISCAKPAKPQKRATRRTRRDDAEDGLLWSDEALGELLEEENDDADAGADCLAVIAPKLLDPQLSESPEGPAAAAGMMQKRVLELGSFSARGLLIAAEQGAVLSEGVMDQLEDAAEQETHLFVALHRAQYDADALEELRFRLGFSVCEVGAPDAAYLRAVLATAAEAEGLSLAPDLDADEAIAALRAYRGAAFDEQDLYCLVRHAKRRAICGTLNAEALRVAALRPVKSGAAETLERMIGLDAVKDTLRRQLAVQRLNARRERPPASACRNLAFCGAPGTGKSVTARLVAQILRDEGCGSGRFVEAGREQLIGAYLGETSHKIAKLFAQAKGGVLFIDEAGALLDGGHDIYAAEAVNALVRHMELEPETMVILATYAPEMQRLLDSNAGLSSRIAAVLRFPDYSDEALCAILRLIAERSGEALPEAVTAGCAGFFAALRQRKGKNFGNGREARRLFEAAREEMALRCLADGDAPAELCAEDLRAAAARLLETERGGDAPRRIGFGAA